MCLWALQRKHNHNHSRLLGFTGPLHACCMAVWLSITQQQHSKGFDVNKNMKQSKISKSQFPCVLNPQAE